MSCWDKEVIYLQYCAVEYNEVGCNKYNVVGCNKYNVVGCNKYMHLWMRSTSIIIHLTLSTERPSRGNESLPACWQSNWWLCTIWLFILLFPFSMSIVLQCARVYMCMYCITGSAHVYQTCNYYWCKVKKSKTKSLLQVFLENDSKHLIAGNIVDNLVRLILLKYFPQGLRTTYKALY